MVFGSSRSATNTNELSAEFNAVIIMKRNAVFFKLDTMMLVQHLQFFFDQHALAHILHVTTTKLEDGEVRTLVKIRS